MGCRATTTLSMGLIWIACGIVFLLLFHEKLFS